MSIQALLGFAAACLSTAMLLLVLHRERRVRRLFRELVEFTPGGIVMWDAKDRLVTWNQSFRDIYALCGPALRRGVTFEALVRFGASKGQYPQAVGREDEFVRDLVEAHQRGNQTIERQLPNGRWILIHEEHTPSGNIIGIRSDITAMKTAMAQVAEAHDVAHHMAHHDALTGLPNRLLFHGRVDAALADLAGGGRSFSVLCLDLDRFKAVNDELGHAGGDELLGVVARRLLAEVPPGSTVARLSGDEFAVLLFETDDADVAAEVAGRIIVRVGAPYHLMTGRAEVGVSIGASSVGEASTRDGLIGRADRALYEAKRAGRGTFRRGGDGGSEPRRPSCGDRREGSSEAPPARRAADPDLKPSITTGAPTAAPLGGRDRAGGAGRRPSPLDPHPGGPHGIPVRAGMGAPREPHP